MTEFIIHNDDMPMVLTVQAYWRVNLLDV
jgi:hypothetical protein